MITEFGVGNFQAFGELQRVPLKPITLIFGPNSAGKSALIRSLIVARHAFLNNQLSKSQGADDGHPGAFDEFVRHQTNLGPQSLIYEFGLSHEESGYTGNGSNLPKKISVEWNEGSPPLKQITTKSFKIDVFNHTLAHFGATGEFGTLESQGLSSTLLEIVGRKSKQLPSAIPADEQEVLRRCIAVRSQSVLPGGSTDDYKVPHILSSSSNDKAIQIFEDRTEEIEAIRTKLVETIASSKDQIQRQFEVLLHHGPLRPLPSVIKSVPERSQMFPWWQLATNYRLRTKVNEWLCGPAFASAHKVDFDAFITESSILTHFAELTKVDSLEALVQRAFKRKLGSESSFLEDQTDRYMSCMQELVSDELYSESSNVNLQDLETKARERAEAQVFNDAADLSWEFFEDLQKRGSKEDMLDYFVGGLGRETEREYKIRFLAPGSHVPVSPSNLGIGFSQMIPLVVSAFASENRLIAIEQPELHIHPALQTELADLFIQSAMERKNRFLIETHSEHLILRVLRRIRETTRGTLPEGKTPIRREDVAVLYVQPSPEGSKVIEMRIDEQGRLVDNWPNGFFEERLDELF